MRSGRLVLSCLIACVALYSQTGPPTEPPRMGHGFGGGLGTRQLGMHPGKVVTNAPYSADVSNSVVQALSDGNVIQRSTTGKVARDAAGRIYSQETISGGPFGQTGPRTVVFISDPVAGYSYTLNTATKEAIRRVFKPRSDSTQRDERYANQNATMPDVSTLNLGTQLVNGVNAEGKRTSRTIAAGAVGNAQPISSTIETWYSPDLQVVVSSKRNDPRFGQATYSLSNIQRQAPDPMLFQIPAGYSIKDAPAGHFGGPPPPR